MPNTNKEYNFQIHCAVNKCQIEMAPNGEGGLDLTGTGGYGDFRDDYDGDIAIFRLCHKHAHKFTRWINNPEILHPVNGHSHSGSENGFWYGHVGWESKTWLSHLNLFFSTLYYQGFKTAVTESKWQIESNLRWARENINDNTTPINWKQVIVKLIFLDYASKGFTLSTYRKVSNAFNTKRFKLAEYYYRKDRTLYSEIWDKAFNDNLSVEDKNLIKALSSAFAQLEEE